MATATAPLFTPYYNPNFSAGGGNVSFDNTTNPVKAAQSQRQYVTSQGDQYQTADKTLADEYAAQQGGTQAYLDPIAQSQASGQGGYSPTEQSSIELSPQQQQNIQTAAGISAGAGTAAAVGAADRAYAATGGNPAAMAEYRARAAQTQAANAGQAQTGASVAAQQAASAGAQAVGNARMAQQAQGETYLGNLQAQQGSQSETEQGLAQGAYGTESNASGQATGQTIQAAQLPTTTDKIIGTVAGAAEGAAGAAGLADGYYPHMADGSDDGGMDAVVGEDGVEAIVKAASDPVRSHTRFMADGEYASDSGGGPAGDPYSLIGERMEADGYYPMMANGTDIVPGDALPPTSSIPPGMTPASLAPSMAPPSNGILQNYLANASKPQQQQQSGSAPQQWNKATPYTQAGQAGGAWINKILQMKGILPSSGSSAPGAPSTGSPAGGPWAPGSSGGWNSGAGNPSSGGFEDAAAAQSGSGDIPDVESGAVPDITSGPSDIGSDLAGAFADGYYPHMANGRMGAAFHWSEPRPHAPHVPAGGYTPLNNHPRAILADGLRARPRRMYAEGGMPDDDSPMDPGSAPTFDPKMIGRPARLVHSAKIITSPTRVHLEKDDAVVPLTYRPKAKVRPSAALAEGVHA
jgi:hypothetical protein